MYFAEIDMYSFKTNSQAYLIYFTAFDIDYKNVFKSHKMHV